MKNKKKGRIWIGYRMPARLHKTIEKLLPLYDFNFSAVLDAILSFWESSSFHREQILTLQAMRYKLLEESES